MALPPVDVVISGQALDSRGLVGIANAISGVGLNTLGFIWPCEDSWTCSEDRLTTTWVSSISGTTVEVCTDQ
jgi:hypothetical protein